MCKNYFLDFIHRRPARCHFIMGFFCLFFCNFMQGAFRAADIPLLGILRDKTTWIYQLRLQSAPKLHHRRCIIWVSTGEFGPLVQCHPVPIVWYREWRPALVFIRVVVHHGTKNFRFDSRNGQRDWHRSNHHPHPDGCLFHALCSPWRLLWSLLLLSLALHRILGAFDPPRPRVLEVVHCSGDHFPLRVVLPPDDLLDGQRKNFYIRRSRPPIQSDQFDCQATAQF